MKKLLISVTYIKESGGISSSVVNLLNEIHDKYDITLCVPTGYISSRYHIPENIRILKGSSYLRDIVCSRKQLSYQSFGLKLVRNWRRIINRFILKGSRIENALASISIPGQYDVAIAFSDFAYDAKRRLCYDYYIVSNIANAKKKLAWIHSNPEKLGWSNELAHDQLSKFDNIVVVSEDCKRIFDGLCPDFKSKSKVVLNVYNIPEIKCKASDCKERIFNAGKIHIVTVARIEIVAKRLDRIVKVCQRLANSGYKSFDWTIVGDGGALASLQDEVSSLGLEGIVHFVGHRDNPYSYLAQADAFVLSSDYEGLPMTIKEAQILSTPTFATHFGASEEAIADGVQGEICENSTEGLYGMVKSILDNPEKLTEYRNNLRKTPISNDIAVSQFCEICR